MLPVAVLELLMAGMLSIAHSSVSQQNLRVDTFRDKCPGKKPPEYVATVTTVPMRSKIECAALCQQRETCSSVTYAGNTCQLHSTLDDVPCAERSASAEQHLEKVSNNWCAHGGLMDTEKGTCSCAAGYSGRFCHLDWAAVDDCAASGCQHAGVCVDGFQSYSCSCPTRYYGDFCENDHCVCNNAAQCIVDATSATCKCRAGFSGADCSIVGSHVVSGGELVSVMSGMVEKGDWGDWQYCPTGSFAAGVQVKIEDFDLIDKTGVNSVRLMCMRAWDMHVQGSVMSVDGPRGSWMSERWCERNYWLVSYRIYYVRDRGLLDDTGANGVEVTCRGPGLYGLSEYTVDQVQGHFAGAWGSWSTTCPSGTAMCAIRARVQPIQGIVGDNVGLVDIRSICCKEWN